MRAGLEALALRQAMEAGATALRWCHDRTDNQIRSEREYILREIERDAQQVINSGELDVWHAQTPDAVRRIAADVNAPLLLRLA